MIGANVTSATAMPANLVWGGNIVVLAIVLLCVVALVDSMFPAVPSSDEDDADA